MAELCMGLSYGEIARNQAKKIYALHNRIDGMKAYIVALTLIIITMAIGFTLALNKVKSEPITIQYGSEIVELDSLNLPPLEELK